MKHFDENCVFCKIAAGIFNSYKVYEDDDILAFLDADPETYGHTLVISKEHYDTFLSTPKNIMNKIMNVAQRIGQIQIKALNATGVNVLTNCYESAGQIVKHFHVHVIPRYDKYKLEMKDLEKEKRNFLEVVSHLKLED